MNPGELCECGVERTVHKTLGQLKAEQNHGNDFVSMVDYNLELDKVSEVSESVSRQDSITGSCAELLRYLLKDASFMQIVQRFLFI